MKSIDNPIIVTIQKYNTCLDLLSQIKHTMYNSGPSIRHQIDILEALIFTTMKKAESAIELYRDE